MITYRFYRAAELGDGSKNNPLRNALTAHIVDDGSGANVWEFLHRARRVRYSLALCDSAVHASIAADSNIQSFSPELADEAAVNAWLDESADTLSAGAIAVLESDGCSMAWTSGATTKREVVRYLARLHVLIGDLFARSKFSVQVGTGNGSTVTFTGTLANTPLIPKTVALRANGANCFDQNGGGVLVGDGTGTINYTSGAFSVTFTVAPAGGVPIMAISRKIGIDFATKALNTTVGDMPANLRTAARAWMQSKGLSTAGIINSTTIRAALQYVIESIDWNVPPLGPFTFR